MPKEQRSKRKMSPRLFGAPVEEKMPLDTTFVDITRFPTAVESERLPWYVYRNTKIKNKMSVDLWEHGPKEYQAWKAKSKIEEPEPRPKTKKERTRLYEDKVEKKKGHKMGGATRAQQAFAQMNRIMRWMKIAGPASIPGTIKDPAHNSFHCHLVDGKTTYLMSWEVFEEENIISIIDVDTHENFMFAPKGLSRPERLKKAMAARADDEKFQELASPKKGMKMG